MKYSTKVVWQIEDEIGVYTVLEKDERNWDGPAELACGSSGDEKSLESSSSTFSKTLQSVFSDALASQKGILSKLGGVINRISSGQTGPGYGAQEQQDRVNQIKTTAAAAERNAQQAIQDRSAGQVFGGQSDSSGLGRTSAINKQVAGQIATNVENKEADLLNQEMIQNYEQGRNNAITTASGLNTLAGQYGSEAGMGESGAINENQIAFGQANKINQENNQWQSDLAGLGTGLVKSAAGFATGGFGNLDTTGGSTGWEQAKNFLSGGFSG